MYALLTSTVNTTITQILTDAASVYTKILGWVGETLEVIESEPLLMITFYILLGGTAVGFISRLIRR